MRTISTTTTTTLAPEATASLMRSSWHSPIPYLFGGLAAMLGLIAFALLILACSYWKLSSHLQSEENENRDLENGEKECDSAGEKKVYEEKILVIMAGDQNPTFLATPVYPKSLSFSDGVKTHLEETPQNHEASEKTQKEMENHLQPATQQPQEQETQQQS
ncbi:protein GLUTAMINE DUMPER 5-like [Lotus japonicus]|uniref:protein GLUTAMINE DUMPER 5-like n=1 Tax=Lotus japonicus TaxID=34305 RepID=UPI00258E766D|nr:protein GLUTAMINE DUMPER 5-like [Lotus japonicus]